MFKNRFDRYLGLAQQFGARTVFFQTAAARRLELTATELECFRLVQHGGSLTASDLVQETVLTPASLSVIVDKLVTRAFLSREQDPNDRRRWRLRTNQAATAKVEAVYAAHASRAEKLLGDYSDEEFEVILRFMDRFADELKATAISFSQDGPARERGKHLDR